MRIALIEDHAVVRAGLRLLLEAHGHQVVAEYGSAAEAEHLPEGLAEVAILDLALPDRPGLSLIPRLRRRAKVLVLSLHADPAHVREALRLGAHGYLSKEVADSALLDALAALERGLRYVEPRLAGALAESGPGPERLSLRERQVVELLSRGYSLRQIAERHGISEKTASTYKARALDKLGLASLPELVAWARRHLEL